MRSALKRLLPRSTLAALRRWREAHIHTVVSSGTHDTTSSSRAFAVFGDDSWTEHLVRVYLDAPANVRAGRRLHRADCAPVARQLARRYGLVLFSSAEVPQELEASALRVPRYVGLATDIDLTDEAFLKRLPESARSDVRRIRSSGWSCEVSTDATWAPEFHDRYHRMAIAARHGREGFVMAVDDMVRAVSRQGWEFVKVIADGRCLGAMLGQPTPTGYVVGRLGWLDGDPSLAKAGVAAAAYWFTFQRARSLGLRRVVLGGTPPYLDDGVFQYKMKWGAALDPADTRFPTHRLLLAPSHPDVRAYLAHRALLTLDEAGQYVVVSGKHRREVRISDTILGGLAGWRRLTDSTKPSEDCFVDESLS